LGNSVIAPKVFDITVDGKLNEADWDISKNISRIIDGNEADWDISKNISRIIDGEANDDVNEVNFGVTYKNPDAREGAYLFVGVDVKDAVPYVDDAGEVFIDGDKSGGVKDAVPYVDDAGEVFIDGDKSGGVYDGHDLRAKFGATGVEILEGPDGFTASDILLGKSGGVYDGHDLRAKFGATGVEILEGPDGFTASDILLGFQITADGYSAEIGIPLDKLGLAWNGGLENVSNTSSFGDLTFGELSCGCISVYNSTIGDVILRNPTDMPTNYVGTYEFFDARMLYSEKMVNQQLSGALPISRQEQLLLADQWFRQRLTGTEFHLIVLQASTISTLMEQFLKKDLLRHNNIRKHHRRLMVI